MISCASICNLYQRKWFHYFISPVPQNTVRKIYRLLFDRTAHEPNFLNQCFIITESVISALSLAKIYLYMFDLNHQLHIKTKRTPTDA